MSAARGLRSDVAAQRFVNSYATCPLCRSDEVTYEFVAAHRAICGCGGCGLLFANPPTASEPRQSAVPSAVVAALLRAAGVASGTVAFVGLLPDDLPAGVTGRTFACMEALDAGPFDAAFVADELGREADPSPGLNRLVRALKAGAPSVFTFPSTSSPNARRSSGSWPAFATKDASFLDVDTAQLLLSRHGFEKPLSFVDAADLPGAGENATWFGDRAALVVALATAPAGRTLSVIVPVYNERRTLAELLDRVLAKQIEGVTIEVIVVESGSTDGSADIVASYARHPAVRVIVQDAPQGKGNAVRAGLEQARGEVVLFQDADLEYDVNDYDALVGPLFERRRNFVLGSRHNATGDAWKIRRFKEGAALSFITNFAHLVFLWLFNRVNGTSLMDPFTMFKVFRRDCIHGLTFECNRFDFDFEITMKLLRKGYRPQEIPVNYNSRGFSEGKKVRFFSDPPTWLRALIRQRTAPLYPMLRPPAR